LKGKYLLAAALIPLFMLSLVTFTLAQADGPFAVLQVNTVTTVDGFNYDVNLPTTVKIYVQSHERGARYHRYVVNTPAEAEIEQEGDRVMVRFPRYVFGEDGMRYRFAYVVQVFEDGSSQIASTKSTLWFKAEHDYYNLVGVYYPHRPLAGVV
jgi:hypothetical protein